MPCYRSTHSDAMSVVSDVVREKPQPLQITDMGTGEVLTELDLVAPSAPAGCSRACSKHRRDSQTC